MKMDDTLFTLFFKVAYISIMVIIIAIIEMATYCIAKMLYPEICLGSFAEIFTAIIAAITAIVAWYEYAAHKDVTKAQVLSEYNKRFSEDPNIVNVVKYLNYIDAGGTKNNPKRGIPSNYEVEMFMRFFEELELQINNGRLNQNDVFDLFIYYAYELYKNKILLNFLGVTDIDTNWKRYKRLMENYEKNNNNINKKKAQ